MTIAYLFHGHSRTWKDCYQSFFDNVFSVIPGDVYMHTWDRVNSKYGSFWNGIHNNSLSLSNVEYEEISSKTLDLDSIKKIYNPKHIIVETDNGIDLPLKMCPNIDISKASLAHISVYNMVKAQHDVFNLSKMYGEYDVYFSLRPDMIFKSKFDKNEIISNQYMMVPKTISKNFYQDSYAFGPKKFIEIRANFLHSIYEYWYSKNNLYSYYIEHAATQYYNDNNIQVGFSNLKSEFVRLF